MNSEEKILISFLFKRTGKQEMKNSEMYLSISMDLKWCNPKQAKSFIESAVNKDLLKKKNDLLKPNFNIEKIEIPVGFEPSENFFEEFKQNKSIKKDGNLIEEISVHLDKNQKEVIKEIDDLAKRKNIDFKVASLLKGKETGVEIKKYLDTYEKELFG
ncbi:MAG: DUF2240 family protein [Candidatus Thermoplasmatota archaeon]